MKNNVLATTATTIKPSRQNYSNNNREIIKIALCSRILVLLISILSSFIIEDYDTSSQLLFENEDQYFKSMLSLSLKSLTRWDAVYFLTISSGGGYAFEQQFAFFPVLPLLMRFLASTLLKPLDIFDFSVNIKLALAGVLISNISLVVGSWVLYKLTKKIFHNEKLAFASAVLFSFTPTPGFMSSIYTESLFSLLAFSGVYLYHSNSLWAATLLWGISTGVRSNGILFIGYILFDVIFVYSWRFKSVTSNLWKVTSSLLQMISIGLAFFSFQIFAFRKFCFSSQPVSQLSPWCEEKLPLIYLYVQKRYWDCGFLTYYKVSQIPNFLLAFPFILLSTLGIYYYASFNPKRFFSIGLLVSTQRPGASSDPRRSLEFHESADIMPHIYLWGVMLLYCLLCMHVQVMLRFLSSSPALYWFTGHIVITYPTSFSAKLIVFYWVVYGLTSTVLFANFFPPA